MPVEVKKEIKTENGDASGIPLLPDFDAITAAESGTRVLARNVHSDYQALAVKVQLVLDVQLKKLGIWIPPMVRHSSKSMTTLMTITCYVTFFRSWTRILSLKRTLDMWTSTSN